MRYRRLQRTVRGQLDAGCREQQREGGAAHWVVARNVSSKAHGASAADRWDRIAEEVPGKTRAECTRRYKQIVAALKAKKAAAAAAAPAS